MRAPRPVVLDAALIALLRINQGAREAHACGMPVESIMHYATHWPNGIGVGTRATEHRLA